MQINQVKVREPKTEKAALNQAAYMTSQISNCRKRKENITMNIGATEKKLEKLKETLENQHNLLLNINKVEENWEDKLEKLKLDYNLTNASILEAKSALLRQQIENLTRESVGIKKKDTDLI